MPCRNCCSVSESICITTLMLVHHCGEIVRHSGAMSLPKLLAWTREHVMGIKGEKFVRGVGSPGNRLRGKLGIVSGRSVANSCASSSGMRAFKIAGGTTRKKLAVTARAPANAS
jgi:hypothetical protein